MSRMQSLYWKLLVLVAGFCLSLTVGTNWIGMVINQHTSFLSDEARTTLRQWAAEAGDAIPQGSTAVQGWEARMRAQEGGWLMVADLRLDPLSDRTLNDDELRMLSFVRSYEWPMSLRSETLPLVSIPINEAGDQIVMRLPERFRPWRHRTLLIAMNQYVVPALLSGLFCWVIYIMLISPLRQLSRQANALRANSFDSLLPPSIARRTDELGELGRSLESLTRRLHESAIRQRQLLHDVSHELRTPLSRLNVARESTLPPDELRARMERETSNMQTLVDSTLELAWLDSERPQFECEPIDVAALWGVIAQDAAFESGWSLQRLPHDIPAGCKVRGNLNALARAMENVLRNAIRHSPPDGEVRLSATRQDDHWILCISDNGPGVPESNLEKIFHPFARLNSARPDGDGFGLGLAIAQRMMQLQQGELWAENGHPGLLMKFRLLVV